MHACALVRCMSMCRGYEVKRKTIRYRGIGVAPPSPSASPSMRICLSIPANAPRGRNSVRIDTLKQIHSTSKFSVDSSFKSTTYPHKFIRIYIIQSLTFQYFKSILYYIFFDGNVDKNR